MPVKVRCTSCDKVLTVPDAARGKAVKCPQCETRIAVPADDDSGSGAQRVVTKSGGDKAKKKQSAKSSRPADSEDTLTTLDLRRVEDTNARVCAKCGFDMQYLDEEETECPQCGYDIEAGGLGKKAQKRQMKGPDPADFYPGLFKSSWKFVGKNQMLAWRTDAYIAVCLLLALGCGFMYLWMSAWPPRVFFALCFTVAIMVIPGWLWVLDIEVTKLTLERKDKFKKLNFDFFLASAMGLMSVAWVIVVGLPLMIVPLGIGYFLVNNSGQPPWVLGVCAGIGAIPVLWMLPVAMSHMSMVVSTPGWMVWKVVPGWVKTIKPLSVWLMWLLITTLPLTGGAAVIGAVWGNDLANIAQTMEDNGRITRAIAAAENAPKGKNAPPPPDPKTFGEIREVDFKPLIGPAIILAVMCLPIGFIAMFNMRINGQFTYYNKNRLDLIDRKKEYKYIAKKKVDEDEDEKPRTLSQDLTDAVVITVICYVLGGVGGLIYGNMSDVGMVVGIVMGLFWGGAFGCGIGKVTMSAAAWEASAGWGLAVRFVPFAGIVFAITHWEEARKGFLIGAFSGPLAVVLLILALVGAVNLGFIGGDDGEAPGVDPTQQAQPAVPAGMEQPPAGAAPAGAGPAVVPPAAARPSRSPNFVWGPSAPESRLADRAAGGRHSGQRSEAV